MAKLEDIHEDYRNYIAELEDLVAEQGWDLKKYPRTTWWAFKPAEHGKSAFGIGFRGNTPYLYIKRVQCEAAGFSIKMSAWNETDDQAEYELKAEATRLKSFMPLLKLAYQRC